MRVHRGLVFLLGCLALVSPPAHSAADDAPRLVVTERSPEDQAIYDALQQRRAWKFAETPLAEVRAEFARELKINVAFDTSALETAGILTDRPVSLDLREASAKTAFDLVCRQLDLDWMVRDGVLLVTTTEEIEQHLETRVYNVAAICPPFDAEGIELPFDRDSLIELITSAIAPTSWPEGTGPSSLGEYESGHSRALVIPQTREVHELIEPLLARLARLRQSKAKVLDTDVTAADTMDEATKRINIALDTRKDWELKDVSLETAMEAVEDAIGIDVVIDRTAMNTVGPISPLSISLQHATARAALQMLLQSCDLTWTYFDDVVLITTTEEGESSQQVRVYDVDDLFPERTAAGNEIDYPFETLIELITSSVEASSWTEVGGTGAIQEFASGPMKVLVIAQTPQNHAAIEKLLGDLRTLRAQTPKPPEGAVFTPIPAALFGGGGAPLSESPLPRDGGDMTDRSRRFAVKLYRELAAKEQGNVLVSPYSAFDALGMVYVGARGQAATELAQALECTGVDQANMAPVFGRVRRGLLAHARLGKSELRIANRLWGQQDYPFLPEYIEAMNSQFDSTPELVDFKQNVAAATRINEWAAANTAGRITDVVDPSDIDDLTRFMLANAVYFKAPWATPFHGQNTRRGIFKAPDGEPRVQYMNQRIRCEYAENDDLQLASLPYDGDRFSMVFLLPRLGRTTQQLEEKLTSERLHASTPGSPRSAPATSTCASRNSTSKPGWNSIPSCNPSARPRCSTPTKPTSPASPPTRKRINSRSIRSARKRSLKSTKSEPRLRRSPPAAVSVAAVASGRCCASSASAPNARSCFSSATTNPA